MNLFTQIFKSIPLIAIGFYLVYETTKEPDQDFIFDFVWVFAKIIVGVILYLWTFNNNRKEYTETSSFLSFLPTISGVVLPLMFFFTQTKDNPTIIRAVNDGDAYKVFLDLREDGTYQLSNGSALGSDYFYGQYQIKDSIIMLDKSNIDKVIESSRLVIRPNLESLYPDYDTLLYQLDNNGKVLPNALQFRLRKDNRKIKNERQRKHQTRE